MKILLDTNVIIDYIEKRGQFAEASTRVFNLCEEDFFEGFIAAQSVADIFYILRKKFTVDKRKDILNDICETLDIAEITKWHVHSALADNVLCDLEDGIIMKCAEDNGFDFIITRNVKDFESSKIPIVTPQEFLDKIRL